MKYLAILLAFVACNASQPTPPPAAAAETTGAAIAVVRDSLVPPQYDATGKLLPVNKTDAEWRKTLNNLEYNVLREEGTEHAFSGDLWDNHAQGIYTCRGCGLPLFDSSSKFESGTGWPSFYQPLKPEYVRENADRSYGMTRVEVECARCGGHLGHVFDDGPAPTGLRYCMNSVSLDFISR